MDRASNWTNLRVRFAHRHVQDKIVILEEGNRPYPRCPQCGMFVAQKSLNGRHFVTAFCRRGMERKWRCLAEEETWAGKEMALTDYGVTLDPVPSFKHLGQVLAAADNNWLAVVCNIWRS